MHTHPGSSADPSFVDEETFERVFGSCDWALMFIIARSGQTYARLRFNTGPGGQVLLPVEIDWAAWPNAVAEHSRERSTPLSQLLELWMDEYGENVWPELDVVRPATAPSTAPTRELHQRSEGRITIPSDRDLIPPWEEKAWDDQPWEEDPELSALAQMEDDLAFEAQYDNPYTPYPSRRSPLW